MARLATLSRRDSQLGSHLREDRADTFRNPRHDSTRSNGHKPGHQGVFDEILAAGFAPQLEAVQDGHTELCTDYSSGALREIPKMISTFSLVAGARKGGSGPDGSTGGAR